MGENIIEIWEPRYKDNVCLIAKYKVQPGTNFIIFTKAKHLDGLIFKVDSDVILNSPVDSNGKISCFAVPMDALERVEDEDDVN